jgi:hypothetical protein
LEDLCVDAYLKYLETEIVTYVSLTQSKSVLVKGVAKRMLQVMSAASCFLLVCFVDDVPYVCTNLFILAL